MAEVSISVGGRAYTVACGDGQEARVASLAARIDAEAAAFTGAGGAVSEARLLLMSALMIADKLDEAETDAQAPAQAAASPASGAPDLFGETEAPDAADTADALAEIDAAAAKIAALAAPHAELAEYAGAATADVAEGEVDADAQSEADEPKPMTREEMRALRRQRRRAAAQQAQDENND